MKDYREELDLDLLYCDALFEERKILNEDNFIKDKIKKIDSKKVKDESIKAFGIFKKSVRGLYTTNEKQLLQNRPSLAKTIGRGIVLIGLFNLPVVGPLAGIIGIYTDAYLSKKMSDKDKKKLFEVYISKAKLLERKIENCDNDLEKQKYMSLKKDLYTNARKLGVYEVKLDKGDD